MVENTLTDIVKDLSDLYYLSEYCTDEDEVCNIILGLYTKYKLKLKQEINISKQKEILNEHKKNYKVQNIEDEYPGKID